MNTLPPTPLGPIALTVADLEGLRELYERVVGLTTLERTDDSALLGPAAGPPILELRSDPDAPPRPHGTTGLFHLAILVPDRAALARSLLRIARARWPLSGASDHLVSEALYLSDPEGNGIEIYRDRPRAEWERSNGELRMATLPLDLEDVMSALPADEVAAATGTGSAAVADAGMPGGTQLGHVHLQVADIVAAEAFYNGLLGLDVTVRSYPGALFLSTGGYHHHIGLNTWSSAGGPAPPEGARGLRRFELRVPGTADLEGLGERTPEGLELTDPSGNRLLVRAREPA